MRIGWGQSASNLNSHSKNGEAGKMVTRIQFEVNEQLASILESLMADTGIRTKKDLLNNALTFFAWAIREKKAGRTIASFDEQNKTLKEVVMPSLLQIA
jgi:hypothetical protein